MYKIGRHTHDWNTVHPKRRKCNGFGWFVKLHCYFFFVICSPLAAGTSSITEYGFIFIPTDGWILYNGDACTSASVCDGIIACPIARIPCSTRINWSGRSATVYHSFDGRCTNTKSAQSSHMLQPYRFTAIWNTTAAVRQINSSGGRNVRLCRWIKRKGTCGKSSCHQIAVVVFIFIETSFVSLHIHFCLLYFEFPFFFHFFFYFCSITIFFVYCAAATFFCAMCTTWLCIFMCIVLEQETNNSRSKNVFICKFEKRRLLPPRMMKTKEMISKYDNGNVYWFLYILYIKK